MRLLVSYVKQDTAVYDLCCDHGNFGILAHKLNKSKKIHFVDSVETIMKRLEEKVMPFLTNDVDVAFTTADARQISIEDNSSVILAGVGDHLGAEIIENLIDISRHQRWIVSLQKFNVETRKVLNKYPVKVITDQLYKEKSRFRELIVFETGPELCDKVSLIPPYVVNAVSVEEKAYADLCRKSRSIYK